MQLDSNNPAALGLPAPAIEISRRLFGSRRPFLILVCGSRGSGRSTTQMALARLHASCQSQAADIEGGGTPLSLPNSLVRMDNVQDERSVRCAVETVRTGYGLIATMVAGSHWSALRSFHDLGDRALSRLHDMERFAGMLVIYQALMPRVCLHCAVPSASTQVFLPGKGCDHCRESSYGGDVLVADYLPLMVGERSLFMTHMAHNENAIQHALVTQEDSWMLDFTRRCVDTLIDETARSTSDVATA